MAVAVALGLALLPAGAAAPAAASQPSPWKSIGSATELERLEAQARSSRKPLLLYWGATWCPPCNQLKATLFNRQDFVALSRSFVAVHVDGDRPGAQRIGERFKVRGYPTLVLFTPEGVEITRLPGEAEPAQVMELLRSGLAGGRGAAAVLADALVGKTLSPAEWKLLSFYSWETDDERLLGGRSSAEVLAELAPLSKAADAETSTRLWLKALAASDDGKGLKADEPLRDRVRQLLADEARSRAQADVIVNQAPEMVRALADAHDARRPFVAAFDTTLRRMERDATLSRGDRVSALISRVELARLETPKRELRPVLSASLQAEVRSAAGAFDREITDPYERQAVIPSAAYALERAGLVDEAEALLKANLNRSHSPYYLMSQLGGLYKKQGRTAEALSWYSRSFDTSKGPATRLQWGAGYLQALVDLAPDDAARIESVSMQLLDEASRDSGAFYKRSARSLQRVAQALQRWNQGDVHSASLRRLQARLATACQRVDRADGARDRCRSLLNGGEKAAG